MHLFVLLLVGCGHTLAPTDSGADVDAAVDATPDVADTGRQGWEEEHIGVYTIAHQVLSTEPCAPWAVADAPARGLPADATPRILWTWSAADEPSLGILAWWELGHVTLRPTGGVIVRAARGTHVVRLGRNGEFEGSVGPTSVGSLAVLPDDRAVAFRSSLSDTTRLMVLGTDGMNYELPMDIDGPGVQPLTTTENGELVYHSAPGVLNVVCAGDGRPRYEIEITTAGRPVNVSWLQTNSAGQIVVNPRDYPLPAADPLILELPGHPVAVLDAWRDEAWDGMWVFAGGSATQLVATGLVNESEGRVGLISDGAFVWATDLMESPQALLVPDGRVWTFGQRSAALLSPDGDVELFHDTLSRYDIAGEDGSIISGLKDQRDVLVRILPDGTEAWRLVLPLRTPVGDFTLTLSEEGVLYAISGNTIAAIQTDVLPPPGCHRLQCNFQRNGWARPVRD